MLRNILFIIALCSASLTFAEKDYKTGSLNINASLSDINEQAKADMKAFKTELSAQFNKSIEELDRLFDLRMDPAEVYLALEIMQITSAPMGEMIDVYENDHHKGWEFMALEMGIKPDSVEFQALKTAINNKADK